MTVPSALLVSCLMVIAMVVNAPQARTATGNWGGQHISITIDDHSATVDFDCATGTITLPLSIGRNGRFSWNGFYNPEHAGPEREDRETKGKPAIYSGTIIGEKMTLRVRLSKSNEEMGIFTLTKGSSGNVMKCR